MRFWVEGKFGNELVKSEYFNDVHEARLEACRLLTQEGGTGMTVLSDNGVLMRSDKVQAWCAQHCQQKKLATLPQDSAWSIRGVIMFGALILSALALAVGFAIKRI